MKSLLAFTLTAVLASCGSLAPTGGLIGSAPTTRSAPSETRRFTVIETVSDRPGGYSTTRIRTVTVR